MATNQPQGARMVDVGAKAIVHRTAEAEGVLRLRPATARAVAGKTLEKGDALEIARTAAILAIKDTPRLLPLCHPIPLEAIQVHLDVKKDAVHVRVHVQAHAKTGVEMEALVGATVALLTIWDLAKPLEKDARGQYPVARIDGVRVVRKVKG